MITSCCQHQLYLRLLTSLMVTTSSSSLCNWFLLEFLQTLVFWWHVLCKTSCRSFHLVKEITELIHHEMWILLISLLCLTIFMFNGCVHHWGPHASKYHSDDFSPSGYKTISHLWIIYYSNQIENHSLVLYTTEHNPVFEFLTRIVVIVAGNISNYIHYVRKWILDQ